MAARGFPYQAAQALTLAEISDVIEEMRNREQDQERAEWERTRWLAAVLLSPHARKGKTIQPRDLAVFPWEKAERTREDDESAAQRRAELFTKWDEEMRKKHGVQQISE